MSKPNAKDFQLFFSTSKHGWLSQAVSFICLLFFILVFCSNNGVCLVPEASQEAALHSFKSYQDVVIFHFSLPKQVLRATWQFTAFMDNIECPPRKVHIFLKWGSYPVVSVDNATFPPHMHYLDDSTISTFTTTLFEPKSATVQPVYSPEPGDWFVSAYLSPWNERVHQKGLGHKCRYSLGSVALWSQINNLPNIPLNYEKIIKTSETVSYYKLFIPMDVWSFRIDIWGCNFTLKTVQDPHGVCIKNLQLQARVLPYNSHSKTNSVINLTLFDTYTINEVSPFQDTWYYLMVVSSSPINFYIKVSVTDCPVTNVEDVYVRQYLSAPSRFEGVDLMYRKKLKQQFYDLYSVDHNQLQPNKLNHNKKIFAPEEEDSSLCYARYQLVRVKDPQTFSRNYLLRGKEWLTSWLVLTDTNPVILQFDILPLVDIGGTLDIKLNIELDQALLQQNVNVSICINRGRIPKQLQGKVTCEKGYSMELSTSAKSNANLMIPYPQPDLWFITLQSVCYIDKIPVKCKVEEIPTFISVKLRGCVFEGKLSCGKYGACQEIHRGYLYFTACDCFAGRRGWGCTDDSNANSEMMTLLSTLLLTLSNLFFLPAVYLAFTRKHFTEGLVYTSTMLFSVFYHACDQQITSYCIAKFEVLQYCDFFSGMLSFWVTLVIMSNIPEKLVSFCHMLGVNIIAFGVESDKTGLISNVLPLIIGSLLPITSYGYSCFAAKKIIKPKRIFSLTIGLSLVGFGVMLFISVETVSNYQYVHSLWHVMIALSLIFLLPPKKEDDGCSNKSVSDKLSSLKESPDDFDFVADEVLQDNSLITEIS